MILEEIATKPNVSIEVQSCEFWDAFEELAKVFEEDKQITINALLSKLCKRSII